MLRRRHTQVLQEGRVVGARAERRDGQIPARGGQLGVAHFLVDDLFSSLGSLS